MLAASPTSSDGPAVGAEPRYAGFGPRLGALVIDQAAIFAAGYFVGQPFGAVIGGFFYATGMEVDWKALGYVGALLVAAFTSFVFEVVWVSSHLQATPGKLALQLKVTDVHGERIGFLRASGRYLLKPVSGAALCVGFLIQPFTEKKQALHDMFAGTLVLKR